jgi:hypothetical protein
MTPDPILCQGHQELRDIVIETRSDVKHIMEMLSTTNQCIHEHEGRIRTIETVGSTKAEEALETVEKLSNRVSIIEKTCNSDVAITAARDSWWDSIYTKAGVVVGVGLGILGLIIDIYYKIRGSV